MIKVIPGDLLTALKEGKVNVIGHQSNCFTEMSGGIARQIKNQFPAAYEADRAVTLSPEERLGKISYWKDKDKAIVNLYGQFHFEVGPRQTDYDALRSAMILMLQKINEWEKEDSAFKAVIGFPYQIGCGLAGGEWDIVEKIIEDVFVTEGKREVVLYQFQP
ncbi:hypothetical protein BEP19_03590 [Ammoniphilus oxalaticus]|uniref:Macro domain-containing protein n=1 Tax=Ammoniphilus oxalaticus TaxID=66863 RepID=A0A419SP72_9BACL|nr:macro domain-containing protein [Ammoniphilus oxalaticus]RKD26019.1 hypothetical protein BEP19_03590 [Ammoniphilus oxalaticus]